MKSLVKSKGAIKNVVGQFGLRLTFYKQFLDEVFVISGIIKVEVSVISRRRLRLITLTETLIISDSRLVNYL